MPRAKPRTNNTRPDKPRWVETAPAPSDRPGSTIRRVLIALLLSFCAVWQADAATPPAERRSSVDLVLFYGEGCPHCALMRAFLRAMAQKHRELRVREYEVYFDPENARLFERVATGYGVKIEGVPTAFLGDTVTVGFSADMAPDLEREIGACLQRRCASPLDRASTIGAVQMVTLSAVVLGAAVDAVNPCAFAVLIILLTAILAAGGRRRALYAGLAFSISIFISYYLMGLGLHAAVRVAELARGLQIVVATLALVIGLFNLKDYFWYGKLFVMEVPLSWRPALKRMIGGVTSVPGAFLVGFAVSLFLLPCTSGPYIVVLGMLASTVARTSALLWLLLYNLIFIVPMLLITAGVYLGLATAEGAEEWRVRHMKILHLVTGSMMMSLGLAIFVLLWSGYL